MCNDNNNTIAEFLKRAETDLNESNYTKMLGKVDKNISSLKSQIDRLINLLLGNSINQAEYDIKRNELLSKLEDVEQEQNELRSTVKSDTQLKKRLAEFKTILEQNQVMTEFDPTVFESIIEKIIIGEVDGCGNKKLSSITLSSNWRSKFLSVFGGDDAAYLEGTQGGADGNWRKFDRQSGGSGVLDSF